ncbi:hypothetical protein CRX42_07390 [Pseudomonas jessenii]|uniref:DUF2190 domain-containing protein n=1 Tax=Pseudomonas jessenii TaxID=77298 RepID=A0A2W0F327_PSEJE|nr:hypothetical protein [Pseudomonas jessenii]PYY71231.1 hypothetical protein CRX42_07390 [Pseudomonas jessenii]
MGIAFDTFTQYAGKAYEGQVNDLSMADITTAVVTAAVPFGRAVVSDTADRSGKLPAAGAGFFLGISARKPVGVGGSYLTGQSSDNGNIVGGFRAGEEASLVAHGRIWVKTLAGAVKGTQVYAVPLTGEITNAATAGNHVLAGCTFLTAAAAGELVLVQIKAIAPTTIAA